MRWLAPMKWSLILPGVVLAISAAMVEGAEQPASLTAAQDYALIAIRKLEETHMNRQRVDWGRTRVEAAERLRDATAPAEAYPVIRDAIAKLAEPHTFLVPPPSKAPPNAGPTGAGGPKVASARIGSSGYLLVPTFASQDDFIRHEFTRSIRRSLAEMTKPSTCGWVIDLRQNEGGNMFPALLGLAPLIGPGRIGGVGSAVVPQFWHYVPDRVLISSLARIPDTESKYVDKDPKSQLVDGVREILAMADLPQLKDLSRLPVAVLTSRYTSSSGEAIAVALLGRHHTKTFGEPTAGKATGNIGVRMPDGALLIITVGPFEDRNGKSYSPRIVPETLVPSASQTDFVSPESDEAVLKAAEWIAGTESCRPETLR